MSVGMFPIADESDSYGLPQSCRKVCIRPEIETGPLRPMVSRREQIGQTASSWFTVLAAVCRQTKMETQRRDLLFPVYSTVPALQWTRF